jgi:hypothetical protein
MEARLLSRKTNPSSQGASGRAAKPSSQDTGVKEKGQPFSTKFSGLDRIARRWMTREPYIKVGRVVADGDLDVARLDGAAEELGGHALGEVDVHVHLVQRLVPLEHLLPCAPRSMAGWRGEVPNPWSEREGDPEEKARRGREGCGGSPLWTTAWRFSGASFSAMAAGRSGSRGASQRFCISYTSRAPVCPERRWVAEEARRDTAAAPTGRRRGGGCWLSSAGPVWACGTIKATLRFILHFRSD